ncbi:MAG: trimethylamine methyltransferase family protein, partial [Nitratireductor sp.]|nr:trimethylamine methyltransferase family protein [Nitratireductor sp.]
MSEVQARSRRSGGRSARHAVRAAPLTEDIRPIRPGMEGGSYKPLTEAGVQRIHEAALEAMEVIGFADAPETGVEILTAAGCMLGDDGRIRFPRALVEDMLAKAAKEVTLFARDPARDLHLSGKRVHYGTAGAAVYVVDQENREYRESTVQDLFDAARITEELDNVHFFQRPMVCRDIEDNFEMDLNTVYASCAGTRKHVGTSIFDPAFVDGCSELLHMIAGGEGKWRE